MNYILKTRCKTSIELCNSCRKLQNTRKLSSYEEVRKRNHKHQTLTSKEIRRLFIDYHVKERGHTYVHSSPVFLNNDPSLLYVNAGMNQFKSKLLNKVAPSHKFYHLKKVVNSQKCIRVSGKHNDLDDVGHDLHHHTFFEMLGNWSFGDYFKVEACNQSWHLLTEVYNLPKDRLYVTYFGGCEELNLPADNETKDIWLSIGVPKSHIFPRGLKENFWEMGSTGPCGPCTEIHYDFSENQQSTVSKDLREIWNLVFIQCKRENDGSLQPLPNYSVDTGMGLERLTAVLQGKNSNYDTDLFQPLFGGIEKEFGVRPYAGHVGVNDTDCVDTTYRILADHMRMITVAVADGVFPDIYYEGHVLRKIIRRATFLANKHLKTHPGALSKLVPYVAESLDFFPEISEKISDVIQVLNEEEKMLHKIINKGRKIRNKMAKQVSNQKLDGNMVHELHEVHGLDNIIIQDLASEINLSVDWEDYKKVHDKQKSTSHLTDSGSVNIVSLAVIQAFQNERVPLTDDSYKYNWNSAISVRDGVQSIDARVLSLIKDQSIVDSVESGDHCLVITDKTNFYSTAGGQIADIGEIFSKDIVFHVKNVHFLDGYVFHEGKMLNGKMSLKDQVTMSVDKNHRLGCALNHTASHLLNVALRKIIPYTSQRSSFVDANHLRFGFTSRLPLTVDQIEIIEGFISSAITQKLPVQKLQMSLDEVQSMPNSVFIHGEEYPDTVSVIVICGSNSNTDHISVEPCCGTHVLNTSDLENFVITKFKSLGGTVKTLNAVTGSYAKELLHRGKAFEQQVLDVKNRFDCLKDRENIDECKQLLKDVKNLLKVCNTATDVPLRFLKRAEDILIEMKLLLNNYLESFDVLENPKSSSKSDNVWADVSISESRLHCKLEEYVKKKSPNPTVDSYKYNYAIEKYKAVVAPVSAHLCDVLNDNGEPVNEVERGHQAVLITDKTNFYHKYDGQDADKGTISGDNFNFDVRDVYSIEGCIFHDGWVMEGTVKNNAEVEMTINSDHRHSCSSNHTASHLLHSALKKQMSHMLLQSSSAGGSTLDVHFKSNSPLTDEILQSLENLVNLVIQKDVDVKREIPSVSSEQFKVSSGENSSKVIPVISIGAGEADLPLVSVEPCFGTHVFRTSEIGKFVIITGKSAKDMEKVIRAVTGRPAEIVIENGREYSEQMSIIEAEARECLESEEQNMLKMWDMLKEIKAAKNLHEVDLPLLLFRNHQENLSVLASRLKSKTKSFVHRGFSQVKSEMKAMVNNSIDSKYVVHKIEAQGDGKKIANYALSCFPEKPALFIARDGLKSIVCSCSVPEALATTSFSALLWIQPVGTFLKGRARAQTKDPVCYYSIESNDVDKIEEALEIARKFAESNL